MNIKRYILLLFLSAGAILSGSAQNPVDFARLERVRQNPDAVPHGRTALDALILRADKALSVRVQPVSEKEISAVSGDPHDYVSMGPYWWPDPAKPDGLPYIRRDGERNPELNKLDRVKLDGLVGTVNTLAYAYFFTGRDIYAEKAVADLRKWFIDPQTRMNPNLDYAQMIPGHNGGLGRSAGLIDTYCFVELVDCIVLLETSPAMTPEILSALKQWFSEFADWFLTSPSGLQEAAATNNHSIAYDVQVAAYAGFAGRETVVRQIARRFTETRLEKQIRPDGSMPRELERTMALHYTIYNLDHILDMALLASRVGVDLLSPGSQGGGLFARATAFIAPYLGRSQDEFPYPQINDWEDNQRKLAWTLFRSAQFVPGTEYAVLFEKHGDTPPDDSRWLRFAAK